MDTTATNTPNSKARKHRQRDMAGQVNAATVKPKKARGRPTLYSEALGESICKRLSNGETLSAVCKDLDIHQDSIYTWIQKHPDFAERYKLAKENQASSLLNELLDDSKELENDRALAVRVRADIVRWYASKVAPQQFGDLKRLELKAEISHKHTHELSEGQRRRIAESWLLSRESDAPLLIDAESTTSGPDREPGVIVQEEEPKELPKRKAAVATKKSAIDADEW